MNRPGGITKKPALLCSDEFRRLVSPVSKAALVDALWYACQLGTNDTDAEYTIRAAREIVHALRDRGDRVPADLQRVSVRPLTDDV